MTIWLAIVPVNLRQLSWQVWSFTEEGKRRKVLLSGDDLAVVDSHTGTELSRTRLPISLSGNGMLRIAAILFDSVTVPPYIDKKKRRMYLPVTELGGKVNQALDALRVTNHIMEVSW